MPDSQPRYYSWKFIPVLLTLSVLWMLLVFYKLSQTIPDFGEIGFPNTLEKAQKVADIFQDNIQKHYIEVLVFQISGFVFFQTWSIPGSFFFNLLGGAIYGLTFGLPLCLICNVIGATNSYYISKFFLGKHVEKRFGSQLNDLRQKVEEHRSDLLFYMISIRMFPMTPNQILNLIFPHISNISTVHFVISVLFGMVPWNFISCNAGVIIKNFSSRNQIVDFTTYLMLAGIAGLFMIPPIAKKIAKRYALKPKSKTQ